MARVIVLIVALFSIYGTLSVSVMERYREIGTLRAFGTRRRQLVLMLLLEGLMLGRGGACLLSARAAEHPGIINAAGGLSMPAEPGMSVSSLRISFTPQLSSFLGNGGWLLAAALLAALVPAALASRRTAAELLHSR